MAETFTGTWAQMTAHVAALHARGDLEAVTPPKQVGDGLWTVRYLTARPAPAISRPVPAQPSRWRSLGIAAGVALVILAALVAGVVWLWRHPAALVLTVTGGAGVVWIWRRVRTGR